MPPPPFPFHHCSGITSFACDLTALLLASPQRISVSRFSKTCLHGAIVSATDEPFRPYRRASRAVAQHLRIVDKVSVSPATTYIPPNFLESLEAHKGRVEYRQANLTIANVVAASFESPEGKAPYTIVYDLTGEKAFDKAPIVSLSWPSAVCATL